MKLIGMMILTTLVSFSSWGQAKDPNENPPNPADRASTEAAAVAMGFACKECEKHVQNPYNQTDLLHVNTNPGSAPGGKTKDNEATR